MRFTLILHGYQHDSYSKMTTSYGEYGITLPAIYLLTLELKQSKAISSYFLPRTIASLAALATRIFTTVLAGILSGSPVAGLRPMRVGLWWSQFSGTSIKEPFFLVWEVGSSMGVARTVDAVL
jgi:hypothetical protein